MNGIETRNLSRNFGAVTAVADLNLQVPKGSLFGLIGPNGAGKTTTIRMLAGLLEPSHGEVYLNGIATNGNWREHHSTLGYMPDFFGVYEDMLVWEYLDFYARCYDLPADHRSKIVGELLELVDLQTKKDAYVETLSRGMRQRLCLAHTLVNDPDILLLDEPASGLDPRARVEMRELLKELGSMGKTIVVSSHILTELAELCDHVAIIEKGQLIASGSLADISKLAKEGKTLKLMVSSDISEAKLIIEQLPNVQSVYMGDNSLEVDFIGGDEEVAEFISGMVSKGIKITSINESVSNLEEAFLRLTKGEVS